jgi:hypothetical protein
VVGGDRLAIGPIIAAAGEEPHRLAVPAHDQPVTVVLDLVHPIGAGWRLGSTGRDAGVDEAVGANNEHGPSNSRSSPAGGVVTMPRNGRPPPRGSVPYKDPEKRREGLRKWRAANPVKAREANQKWRNANRDKTRQMSRKYREANLEKVRTRERQYQATKRARAKGGDPNATG